MAAANAPAWSVPAAFEGEQNRSARLISDRAFPPRILPPNIVVLRIKLAGWLKRSRKAGQIPDLMKQPLLRRPIKPTA
jgi:hypothetical protein